MFSTVGLFKRLKCPEESHCQLINCLFSHTEPSQQAIGHSTLAASLGDGELGAEDSGSLDSKIPHKRRRIDIKAEYAGSGNGLSSRKDKIKGSGSTANGSECGKSHKDIDYDEGGSSTSVYRPVSPPPLRNRRAEIDELGLATTESTPNRRGAVQSKISTKKSSSQVTETLNPRMINKPPAAHTIRLKLVTMLFDQMVKLNDEIKSSKDPSRDALVLSPQEIIAKALDEEEKTAKETSAVYTNVMKLRITVLRKMKVDEWKNERLQQIHLQHPQEIPQKANDAPVPIDSGLEVGEEIALLSKLTARPKDLVRHGYAFSLPSEAEIEQAQKGKDAANGWEQCDRCKTRFQVFPGRRAEDGALTTGGKCLYHYGKPRRPVREKADSGYKDTSYSCCNQTLGTLGCTTADTHVFKISELKALALVMQFKKTPRESSRLAESAVCFDCEMGYTTLGMELIRLTATSWPKGRELLDILVRPIGEILDLNSRFSGVWPHHFNNALPYEAGSSDHGAKSANSSKSANNLPDRQLYIVDSPFIARELLFDLLTTQTPLMGHALENDLNAVRVIHPIIVDTVLLYPHPHGLPIRHGLKMLVKRHLNRDIQMGGAQGHDSKEDATAAGDLIKLKVSQSWKAMARDGWTVNKGVFTSPLTGQPASIAELSTSETGGAKRKRS